MLRWSVIVASNIVVGINRSIASLKKTKELLSKLSLAIRHFQVTIQVPPTSPPPPPPRAGPGGPPLLLG